MVEQIPIVKMCQAPGQSMVINVRMPATSYLASLFTYLVLFYLLLPSYLNVPCYLNNRQRYCSVWPERDWTLYSQLVKGFSAIPDLLKQGGIEDLTEKAADKSVIKDISKFVVIFFGNLGTFKQIHSLLIQWSLEENFWCHYQYVVVGMGLFHLKIASVNTIRCIFINSLNSHQDPNSLIKITSQHRPKETWKIIKGPQFCQMRKVIMHNGHALWLDC